MKNFFTLALLISLYGSAQHNKNVLFLGNSYTYGNNLPALVANIAESLGDSLYHDQNTPGGYTLNGHSTNNNSIGKIQQGGWDRVVLQDQSQIPSLNPAFVATNSLPYAMALSDTIYKYNDCGKPLFFMTWGRQNGDAANCPNYPPSCTYEGMQGRLRSSYLLMGTQNNAPTSPVGAVWREFRDNFPNTNLYAGDGSHPNLNGSYLAACTFYASIYHKSPVGAWKPLNMDSTLAFTIQTQTNTTVFDSLNVWGIDTTLPPNNTVWNIQSVTLTSATYNFAATDSLNLDSVTWDFGDGSFGSGFQVSHDYTSTQNYSVISKHWKNCTWSTNTISHNGIPPGSLYESASSKFNIYPNPSLDRISVQTELKGKIDYSILSTTGQIVLSGKLQNEEINLSALGEGLYILLLEVDGKLYRQKVIKE